MGQIINSDKTGERIVKSLLVSAFAMLFVLSLAACGAKTNEDLNSGIKGIAMVGPVRPVARQGELSDKPYPDAVIVVKSPDGKEVARANADEAGAFVIKLPPGKYQIEPTNKTGSMLPFAQPFIVEVKDGEYTEVTVSYDSGIR